MNNIRSATNFFSLETLSLGEDTFFKRLFCYYYLNSPIKPRYTTFWPVSKLFDFLKLWRPIRDLSLKQLTLKAIALMTVTASDSGKSLHLAKLNQTNINQVCIEFVIKDFIKTSRI